MATEFFHAGFLCRRVIGSKLGRRGRAKTKYGWIIIDPATQDQDEVDRLLPIAEGGVSEAHVRLRAEQLREMRERGL